MAVAAAQIVSSFILTTPTGVKPEAQHRRPVLIATATRVDRARTAKAMRPSGAPGPVDGRLLANVIQAGAVGLTPLPPPPTTGTGVIALQAGVIQVGVAQVGATRTTTTSRRVGAILAIMHRRAGATLTIMAGVIPITMAGAGLITTRRAGGIRMTQEVRVMSFSGLRTRRIRMLLRVGELLFGGT